MVQSMQSTCCLAWGVVFDRKGNSSVVCVFRIFLMRVVVNVFVCACTCTHTHIHSLHMLNAVFLSHISWANCCFSSTQKAKQKQ